MAENGGNGGVRYTPREMFDRIEQRLDSLVKHVEISTVELKKEIQTERHRLNSLEGQRKLETYTYKLLKEDLEEMKQETKAELENMKEETKSQLTRLEMKVAPMTTFLNEQSGVEKWKKRFLVVAGLAITIVGIVGGWIMASSGP